jgi:hypothetical protein
LYHRDDKKTLEQAKKKKIEYKICGMVKNGDGKKHKKTGWQKKNKYGRCG